MEKESARTVLVDQSLAVRSEDDAPDVDGRILLKKPVPSGNS